MNEEMLALKTMEETHGSIHKPMDANTVRMNIMNYRMMLTKDTDEFIRRPSAKNFSSMKMSMYWYQYWSNKATYDEVEE
jgi:hypothetical protein